MSPKAFCRRLNNGASDSRRAVSSCLRHLNRKVILDLRSAPVLRFSAGGRSEGALQASFLNKASTVKKSAEKFLQTIPQAPSFLTGATSHSPLQWDSPL